MFYVVAAAFGLSAWLLHRVTRSPFGMALRAIRDNPTWAALAGIRVRHYQWSAFVISGSLTGLAGALTGLLDRLVRRPDAGERAWNRLGPPGQRR